MEVEAKYRIVGPLDPVQIEKIDLSPYRLTFESLVDHRDEVVDAEDGRLADAGLALRVRRDLRRVIVTLKRGGSVEGAVHSREEIETEWTDEALARGEWPPAVWDIVGPVAADTTLTPIINVRNRRYTWFASSGVENVVEIAFDDGTISAGDRTQPFAEIEVEAKGRGTLADVNAIGERLAAALPLEPEPRSKFDRGLALLREDPDEQSDAEATTATDSVERWPFAQGRSPIEALLAAELAAAPLVEAATPAPPSSGAPTAATAVAEPADAPAAGDAAATPGVEPEPDVPPALQPLLVCAARIIGANLDKLLEAEPVAREGLDAEGVHDMRVATRRMRAAFQILIENGQSAKSARTFHKRLASLARTLGTVRDADVLLGELEAYAAEHPPEEVAGLGPLRADLDLQRALGRKQMLLTLNEPRTEDLFADIRRWCEKSAMVRPRAVLPPEPQLVRHFAHTAVWRRYEEILAYETAMPLPIPALHRLRIAGKHMRYTLEFFEEVLGPGTRNVLKQLAGVQDRLGELHDAEVAMALVDDLAQNRQGTAALQSYRDHCREAQDTYARDFGADWELLTSAGFRRRLGDLVTNV